MQREEERKKVIVEWKKERGGWKDLHRSRIKDIPKASGKKGKEHKRDQQMTKKTKKTKNSEVSGNLVGKNELVRGLVGGKGLLFSVSCKKEAPNRL